MSKAKKAGHKSERPDETEALPDHQRIKRLETQVARLRTEINQIRESVSRLDARTFPMQKIGGVRNG